MHSVNTAREFTGVRYTLPGGVPANSDAPVLTIAEPTMVRREITFYQAPNTLGLPPKLVVNPWGDTGKVVSLTGEDLFALREFLNEFPEEAFVRPADPVEKSRWTDGDVILEINRDNQTSWWKRERRDGTWPVVETGGSATNAGLSATDEAMTHYVESTGNGSYNLYVVLREQGAE